MKKLLLSVIVALVLNVSPTWVNTADAQVPTASERITFQDAILIVPPISGFRFPSGQERNVLEIVKNFVLPNNRLLAALLTDADLRKFAAGHQPELDDYFVLQIPRSIENRAVTLSEFQPLRRGIRDAQESAQFRVSPTVKRQLADAAKQTSDRTGVKIVITITDPIALGVFEDTESSIGVTLLAKVRADAPTARSEDLMVSASVATVVRGKFLYLNGACAFLSMSDISRCNSHVKAWLAAVQAANR